MMWLYVPLVAIAAAYLVYCYITRTFNYWKDRNVAYMEPVPLFGNMKESAFQRKYFADVLKDIYNNFPKENVVGIYTMTTPVILLRDPDLVKHIFIKDFDVFYERGIDIGNKGVGSNLFHADGETWRVLRTKFTPIFTSGKLKNMFHLITERGDKFLDYIEEEIKMQPEQNVLYIARMFTMSSIAACAFGLDIDYHDPSMDVLKRLDELLFSNTNRATEIDMMYPGIFKRLKLSFFPREAVKFFHDLVKMIFKERNGVPSNRNDFMDLMIQLKQQKVVTGTKSIDSSYLEVELTDEMIAAQAFIFYVAGFETSSTTLGFLLYELARHPEIQDKMINEIDALLAKHDKKVSYDALTELPYMFKVIDETLRMYPIIDPIKRRAVIDYKVPGTDLTIKKGQSVFVSVAGLHYDPKYYPNPEVFDPERFFAENSKDRHSYAYLPFGTGPRNCIGMRFARAQTSVFLVKLLSRFRVEPSENTHKNMIFEPNRRVLGPKGGAVPLKLVHRFK